TRRLLVPGSGARADCVVEWAATAPPVTARPGRRPLPKFVCRDGDPACDTDAVADQCTIEVQPCAAVADDRLPHCTPAFPASIRVTAPGADTTVLDALTASSATVVETAPATAGSCGPA